MKVSPFQCSVSLLAACVRCLGLTVIVTYRTVLSSKPTTLSWCWPTQAPSSSTRSPHPTPECWWTSGGRCLVTCQPTWRSGYTHSCQVKKGDTMFSWDDCCCCCCHQWWWCGCTDCNHKEAWLLRSYKWNVTHASLKQQQQQIFWILSTWLWKLEFNLDRNTNLLQMLQCLWLKEEQVALKPNAKFILSSVLSCEEQFIV